MHNGHGPPPRAFRVREMEVRYKSFEVSQEVPDLFDSKAAAALASELLRDRTVKTIVALHVSTSGRLAGVQTVAIGAPDWVGFSVSEMLKAALLSNCTGFIVACNRVDAGPEPKDDDIELAARIGAGAMAVSLRLLDFIILAESPGGPKHVSLKARGYIPDLP